MRRYLKPLLVGVSLVAALFLTFYRRGPEGGIGISANKTLSAAPGRRTKNYDLIALKVFNVALVDGSPHADVDIRVRIVPGSQGSQIDPPEPTEAEVQSVCAVGWRMRDSENEEVIAWPAEGTSRLPNDFLTVFLKHAGIFTGLAEDEEEAVCDGAIHDPDEPDWE